MAQKPTQSLSVLEAAVVVVTLAGTLTGALDQTHLSLAAE
jgi:hypothetical protein